MRIYTILKIVTVLYIAYCVYNFISYKDSHYYQITHNSYLKVLFNNGVRGEYEIYKKLKRYQKNGAKLLYNCYLPKNTNETTEIDVLMIHKKGIFVIESKNYSGWIFGNEDSYQWTQTLPRGNKLQKEHFYNPIKQNSTHIKWLKSLLGLPDNYFYSFITFSERCTLKDVNYHSRHVEVFNRYRLIDFVEEVVSSNNDVLTQSQIDSIEKKVYPYTQITKQEKLEHINRIKNESNKIDELIVIDDNNQTCPRCGASLVLRTARKGDNAGKQFYGCSNYPKCRYTRNI